MVSIFSFSRAKTYCFPTDSFFGKGQCKAREQWKLIFVSQQKNETTVLCKVAPTQGPPNKRVGILRLKDRFWERVPEECGATGYMTIRKLALSPHCLAARKGPRKQEAARMHSFYSVITFHATDNPLHGQQLQTQAGKRRLLRSNPGPAVLFPLRIGNLLLLVLEAFPVKKFGFWRLHPWTSPRWAPTLSILRFLTLTAVKPSAVLGSSSFFWNRNTFPVL